MSTSRNNVDMLDAELSQLLDASLNDSTKGQLETMRTQDDPTVSEDDQADAFLADVATTSSGDAGAGSARLRRPDVLASIAISDGAFHFLGIPEHGEIGLAFSGNCGAMFNAIVEKFASPLRLYASIAPLKAPMPWLIAAVDDDQEDRMDLVGERRLCDRVDDVLEARLGPGGGLQVRTPTVQGGLWTPDPVLEAMAVNYCTPTSGQLAFQSKYCEAEWNPGPPTQWNIFKCTSQLSQHLTHGSVRAGTWRTRRCSIGNAWVCGPRISMAHLYWDAGTWWTAEHGLFGTFGPSVTAPFKSPWQGKIRRYRKVQYDQVLTATTGGFRAYSHFSRRLDLH